MMQGAFVRSGLAARCAVAAARAGPRLAIARPPTTHAATQHNRHIATTTVYLKAKAAETHEFQAETKSLMDIVAKSLYSHSEVFVRELVSNASDALEKRRVWELQSGGEGGDAEMAISLTTDKHHSTLTFTDTGIGMSREDLVSCLGTIAKSGSKEFIEKNKDQADAVIGQFGVGFYSAFMVAESVTVTTRKIGSEHGLRWKWTGENQYSIEEIGGDCPTGTKIELTLRPDCSEYAEAETIKQVVNKYSYFVSQPILVDGERVNSLNAIWTMNPSQVTKEQHQHFYSQLARTHSNMPVGEAPEYTIHYKADSPVSLRSLMYIPSHSVSQLEFATQTGECGMSLYARRVLIKPNASELMPRYLRFVMGVVDSEDIPLNLSREMLQNNAVLRKLKKILTEKVLSYLRSQLQKDQAKYELFYKNYALFLKEGVILEEDLGVREDIAKLLLFESSSLKAGEQTTFGDYVGRLPEAQNEIYYMFAPSRQLAESSPYFEMVKSQNKEVLFLLDPADEVVFMALRSFGKLPLVSVEKWAQDEAQKAEGEKGVLDGAEMREGEKKALVDWMQATLGAVRVSSISVSHRQSDHPVMLSLAQEMGAARHFLRTGELKDLEQLALFQPKLHVHLSHPLVKALSKMRTSDPDTAKLLVEQIYDNALISAGLLKDSSKMVGRLNELLTRMSGQQKSSILTP